MGWAWLSVKKGRKAKGKIEILYLMPVLPVDKIRMDVFLWKVSLWCLKSIMQQLECCSGSWKIWCKKGGESRKVTPKKKECAVQSTPLPPKTYVVFVKVFKVSLWFRYQDRHAWLQTENNRMWVSLKSSILDSLDWYPRSWQNWSNEYAASESILSTNLEVGCYL